MWGNNLVSVAPKLLSKIQAVLVDVFWDKLHWIPQAVLFLPKEEGEQGTYTFAK